MTYLLEDWSSNYVSMCTVLLNNPSIKESNLDLSQK